MATPRVTHNNGNQICFDDRSVYVREDQTYYAPDGTPAPLPPELAALVL
jgi:hypothetical protein